MDVFQEGDFLAWFFTYFTEDAICPHCGAMIAREEVEDSFNEGDEFIVCPYCNTMINKEDIEDNFTEE